MSTRGALSSLIAVSAAVLAGVSPAAAFTWNAPLALTATGHDAIGREGIARIGSNDAIVAFWDTSVGSTPQVHVRRTTDGGAHWTPSVTISAAGVTGERASVAADGQTVVASFAGGAACPNAPCGLQVARSVDGGVTWDVPETLSGGIASDSEITIRGLTAVVAWNDRLTGKVRVRVSTDGGDTFNPASVLDTTANLIGATAEARASVAIGSGVIYVSYISDSHTLKLRRSTDGGVTWHPAQTISTQATGLWGQDLAASGNTAVVAFARYVSPDVWIAYRRTSNRGVAWSGASNLTSPSAPTATNPIVDVQGGTWRVLYTRCLVTDCSTAAIFVRTAPDAQTWATQVRVTPGPGPDFAPGGSVVAGKLIVAYTKVRTDTTEDVNVRTGN